MITEPGIWPINIFPGRRFSLDLNWEADGVLVNLNGWHARMRFFLGETARTQLKELTDVASQITLGDGTSEPNISCVIPDDETVVDADDADAFANPPKFYTLDFQDPSDDWWPFLEGPCDYDPSTAVTPSSPRRSFKPSGFGNDSIEVIDRGTVVEVLSVGPQGPAGTGGGGSQEFIDLDDVPSSYSGQAGKSVKVKSTEDGLEFAAGGGGGSGTIEETTNLIKGDNAGAGVDSGIDPDTVVQKQTGYPTPAGIDDVVACLRAAGLCQ